MEDWQTCGQGGQARYTDAAIQTSLILRTAFKLEPVTKRGQSRCLPLRDPHTFPERWPRIRLPALPLRAPILQSSGDDQARAFPRFCDGLSGGQDRAWDGIVTIAVRLTKCTNAPANASEVYLHFMRLVSSILEIRLGHARAGHQGGRTRTAALRGTKRRVAYDVIADEGSEQCTLQEIAIRL